MAVAIVDAGALTTVQDVGRTGWGWCGIPPSGAFDDVALRAANLLVANPPEAAGLEVTMAGPTLEFDEETLVGVIGAELSGRPDGRASRPFFARSGERVRIGSTRPGARGYVAFAGGIDAAPVLGSRSTCVASQFGGLNGRPLRAGDALPLVGSTSSLSRDRPRSLPPSILPRPGRRATLRTVLGAQADSFTAGEQERFFSQEFRVSPDSDRVGVRLQGTPLTSLGDSEIDPEGVVTGDVQVPPDGSPIVLGPDHPTTGGYPKIATVIAADIPLLAQARPGTIVRFALVSIDQAREAYATRERALQTEFAQPT